MNQYCSSYNRLDCFPYNLSFNVRAFCGLKQHKLRESNLIQFLIPRCPHCCGGPSSFGNNRRRVNHVMHILAIHGAVALSLSCHRLSILFDAARNSSPFGHHPPYKIGNIWRYRLPRHERLKCLLEGISSIHLLVRMSSIVFGSLH